MLSVKGNQRSLVEEIKTYVQDDVLRKEMDTCTTLEKNGGRIEHRIAYITYEVDWLYGKEAWRGLSAIGAIHTRFTTSQGTSDEWHYYISSRQMTAEELLRRARLEWSVEAMHWLLDVQFGEDFCRIEDKYVQQSLNIIRKIALNTVRHYKNSAKVKLPISELMFRCLMNPNNLIPFLLSGEN